MYKVVILLLKGNLWRQPWNVFIKRSVSKLSVVSFSGNTSVILSLLLVEVVSLLQDQRLSVQNESISVRELQCEDKYNCLLLLQVANWLLDQKLSV